MASKADIEEPISLVRPANAKMVQAILTRAHKQERSTDKALARMANQALRPVRSKGLLSKALGQAMAHHGRTKKGAASLRPKAPDTNGRAFHFSHSTVGKGASGAGRGAAPGGSGGAGPAATGSSGTKQDPGSTTAGTGSPAFPDLGSREAGHQRYVERDAALARDAVEVFGIPVGKDQAREEGREQQEGWERDPAAERGQSQEKKAKLIEVDIEALQKEIEQASRGQRTQSARAAQEYIEDPSKVAQQTRHGHSNSFGTIGETFEERVSFWNDVTKHERERDARTQIRLVLELPHEASPAVRQEIVKKFCQQYEDLGVPYWASIHAPTKKNDHRNHHAHIVHGIRPTKRIIDPSTGKMAWDFTIAEAYRTSSRNKKYKHPYRQNVVAAFRDRDYVRDTRNKFAEVTNEVLAAHGYEIRYDARSYKDMGIDIEPMKHVSRVIADKAKVRDFVVLDAAWTRRLIDQEMNAAAVERDKTYVELKAVEKRISGLTNDIRKLKEVNPKLPAKMKLSPMSRLTVTAAKQLSQRMLEIEYAKISQRFADEATARTIQHIIDSTAPTSAHRGGKARKIRPMPDGPVAPNPEALKVLHESAKEEMRLHRIATAGGARKLGYMAMGVLHQWQEQAQPKDPPPPTQAPGKAKRATARATAPTMAPPPSPQPPQAARATARHATPTMEPPRAQPTPQQRQSPAFAPDYRAAEAAARQGPAKAARPIYHTPPRQNMRPRARSDAWQTGQMPLPPGFAKALEPMSARNVNAMFADGAELRTRRTGGADREDQGQDGDVQEARKPNAAARPRAAASGRTGAKAAENAAGRREGAERAGPGRGRTTAVDGTAQTCRERGSGTHNDGEDVGKADGTDRRQAAGKAPSDKPRRGRGNDAADEGGFAGRSTGS